MNKILPPPILLDKAEYELKVALDLIQTAVWDCKDPDRASSLCKCAFDRLIRIYGKVRDANGKSTVEAD